MARRNHRPKGPYYHAVIEYIDTKNVDKCRCNWEDYTSPEDPEGKTGSAAACKKFVSNLLDSARLKEWRIMNSGNYILWKGE
jgi:hypothetical protein